MPVRPFSGYATLAPLRSPIGWPGKAEKCSPPPWPLPQRPKQTRCLPGSPEVYTTVIQHSVTGGAMLWPTGQSSSFGLGSARFATPSNRNLAGVEFPYWAERSAPEKAQSRGRNMEPICPECSNNSFKIFSGKDGRPISRCLKCGAETYFEETQPAFARDDLSRKTPAPPK